MATMMPAARAHPPLLSLVPPLLLTHCPGCVPGNRISPSLSLLPHCLHPAASSHPASHPGMSRTFTMGQRYTVIPQAGPELLDFSSSDVFPTAFKNKIPAIKAQANFIPSLFFPGSCRTRFTLQHRQHSCGQGGVTYMDRGAWVDVGCMDGLE